jgi:hypothetical protein
VLLNGLTLISTLFTLYRAVIVPVRLEINLIHAKELGKRRKAENRKFEKMLKYRKMVQISSNLYSFDLSVKNKLLAGLLVVRRRGEREECGICFKNECNVLLEPCLHGGVCKHCVLALRRSGGNWDKCPFCRQVRFLFF